MQIKVVNRGHPKVVDGVAEVVNGITKVVGVHDVNGCKKGSCSGKQSVVCYYRINSDGHDVRCASNANIVCKVRNGTPFRRSATFCLVEAAVSTKCIVSAPSTTSGQRRPLPHEFKEQQRKNTDKCCAKVEASRRHINE